MNLKNYLSTLERGAATKLAGELGISISFLSQISSFKSPASPARCIAIEAITNGVVSRKELRPNDWQKIWPELVRTNSLVTP